MSTGLRDSFEKLRDSFSFVHFENAHLSLDGFEIYAFSAGEMKKAGIADYNNCACFRDNALVWLFEQNSSYSELYGESAQPIVGLYRSSEPDGVYLIDFGGMRFEVEVATGRIRRTEFVK